MIEPAQTRPALLDGAAHNIAGYVNGDFELIALEDAIGQINAAVWMLDQMELSVP